MADNPLWSEGAQAARLAELTADTADPAKELPLRRDVRSLGILLGRVLVEQEGEAFFDVVEQLRHLLIQHREHSLIRRRHPNRQCQPDEPAPVKLSAACRSKTLIASPKLSPFISNSPTSPKPTIASAVAAPLRMSTGKTTGKTPVDGSFRGTLVRMKSAGVSADAMLESLRKVKVTPVFTAHPTEITRHTIRLKRRRIAAYLEHLDQLPLSDSEAREYESLILAEITALWQTDEVRLNKPTVRDEIHMGLDYFPMVLFETLPRLYAELEESLRDVYGAAAEVPEVLSFGSWIGGDRDGNPFVTADSTREALDMARHVIIDHYIAETIAPDRAIEHVHAPHRRVRRPRPTRSRIREKTRRKIFPLETDHLSRTLSPLPRVSDRPFAL